jgi:nucleotide-binding universal stress UspA family protein
VRGYSSILVPLVGGAASERALQVACGLARNRGATITAVSVIEVPPLLPLEAHMREEEQDARRLLSTAEAVADSYGISMTSRILRAREAASAIVEQAETLEVEAIALGAERRPRCRARAPVFGRTVQEVLKHAHCRVIVVGAPTNMSRSRTAPFESSSSRRLPSSASVRPPPE